MKLKEIRAIRAIRKIKPKSNYIKPLKAIELLAPDLKPIEHIEPGDKPKTPQPTKSKKTRRKNHV